MLVDCIAEKRVFVLEKQRSNAGATGRADQAFK